MHFAVSSAVTQELGKTILPTSSSGIRMCPNGIGASDEWRNLTRTCYGSLMKLTAATDVCVVRSVGPVEWMATVVQLAFFMLAIVILMNLLIAMMADTYTSVIANAVAECTSQLRSPS
jgi:hypothetical protein